MDKVEQLIAKLQKGKPKEKADAAKELGKLGDVRAMEPLIATLKDKERIVRDAAAKALDKIDPKWRESEFAKKVVPELIATLKNQDEDECEAAVWAWGEFGDTRAVAPLIDVLGINLNSDFVAPLRVTAAWALGELRDEQAVSALTEAAYDPENPTVALEASKAC